MAIKFGIDTSKFFQIILIGFLLIQGVSWALSSLFPEIPLIKGGWFLFLVLIIILLTTLYTLGKNINQLDIKKDGLLLLLVFGAIVLLFLVLPSIVPEIFSTSGIEFRNFLRESIGTIVQIGSRGVVE